MKLLPLAVLTLLVSCTSSKSQEATLVSPFPSQVPGLSLPNARLIKDGQPGRILRGMRPMTDAQYRELTAFGVTDVLIFRNVLDPQETRDEMASFEKVGLPKERVRDIPFKWKDVTNFREACEQTLQALRLMRDTARKPGSTLFYHCTVGEDRTGYLSALYRRLSDGWNERQAFNDEMCPHGYADGNPQKDEWVVAKIHESLTPLYLKMSHKIREGQLSLDKLDDWACRQDPEKQVAYLTRRMSDPVSRWRCQVPAPSL